MYVADFFVKFDGAIISAESLVELDMEAITTSINTIIEAMPEEGRPKGLSTIYM